MKPIAVINRHCLYSNISANKEKPSWFDREKIFLNLAKEINRDDLQFHVFYDGENASGHFLENYLDDYNFVFEKCGSGAKSFIKALDFAASLDCEIVYFVEDDYVHRSGWIDVLIEGMSMGPDYLTLYDHPDKYDQRLYHPSCSLYTSKTCHWRTTPSTTDTFACKKDTLLKDMEILKKYSTNVSISRDHERFVHLGSLGRILTSCIPGFSNHSLLGYESPTTNWENVLKNA